jgi:hypothetical protein
MYKVRDNQKPEVLTTAFVPESVVEVGFCRYVGVLLQTKRPL